jgi:uncharacterized damage-inducible protein DinB
MASELLEQLKKNFEYDRWANDRYVKALSAMTPPPEKAVKILGHILFAKDVWLARLLGEDLSRFSSPWPALELSEFTDQLVAVQGKWQKYLDGLQLETLGSRISYRNLQGMMFEQGVQNVLVHVVNHSSYHRGQLAPLVTQAGGTRPDTDYIGYAIEIGEGKKL